MKRVMLGLVLVVALMLGGCEETFTPEQMQTLAAQQEVLQKEVIFLKAAAIQITEDLAASGVVDPNALAKVKKINEEADRALAQIAVIARALKGVPLTGDAAQDFIAQLQAANTATAGLNPYALPIGGVLTALNIVLGWLAKRKADEAAANNLKYQAHKQGVEKTMKEVSASMEPGVAAIETKLYTNIGDARADLGV